MNLGRLDGRLAEEPAGELRVARGAGMLAGVAAHLETWASATADRRVAAASIFEEPLRPGGGIKDRTPNWKDTNLCFFGTVLERSIKEAAAQHDGRSDELPAEADEEAGEEGRARQGGSRRVRAQLQRLLRRIDLTPFLRRRRHHRIAAAIVPALLDAASELLAADAATRAELEGPTPAAAAKGFRWCVPAPVVFGGASRRVGI